MKPPSIRITEYRNAVNRSEVIGLWKKVLGYKEAHNEPGLAIDKKISVADHLFFVALSEDSVVGTVMAGYDGHRGWIYSLAVAPECRKSGIGTALLAHAEKALEGLGCVKINLQIVEENKDVQTFYIRNGYTIEKRISMGKRLVR